MPEQSAAQVIRFSNLPSDWTPTAETELITAYIRGLAADIHAVTCGVRVDGGYEVWLQLLPTSTISQVVISRDQYKADQWKDLVGDAIDEANMQSTPDRDFGLRSWAESGPSLENAGRLNIEVFAISAAPSHVQTRTVEGMGMMFPLGMAISASYRDLQPWFWSINGATSVFGSVLGVVISMDRGIAAAFWTGVACYMLCLPLICCSRDKPGDLAANADSGKI